MANSVPAKMDRIEVYESVSLLVLVGRKRATDAWRVLRFKRNRADGEHLAVVEDAEEYDRAGARKRITALSSREAPLGLSLEAVAFLGAFGWMGCCSKLKARTGSLTSPSHPTLRACAGAVRFLEGYYLLFVTRREPVGVIAGPLPLRLPARCVPVSSRGSHTPPRAFPRTDSRTPPACLGHSIFRVEETAMLCIKFGGFASFPRRGFGASAANANSRAGMPPPTPPPPPRHTTLPAAADAHSGGAGGAGGGGGSVSAGGGGADSGASGGGGTGGIAEEAAAGDAAGGAIGRVLQETAASLMAKIQVGEDTSCRGTVPYCISCATFPLSA